MSKTCIVECKNNLSEKKVQVKETKKKNGTKVEFIPDYQRFGEEKFLDTNLNALKLKLLKTTLFYDKLTVTFNKEKLRLKNFKEYIKLYGVENVEILETRGLSMAVMHNPEDTFKFDHMINAIDVLEGGTPLDWVTNNIVDRIYEKLKRKFKTIKKGDIKNKIFIVAFFYDMVNPRFGNQIKTICKNTYTEFKSQIDEPDWDKFVNKILKNDDIMLPITELFLLKEEAKKNAELKKLSKTKKKIKSEKYLPSIGKRKYLFIVEGESALGGLLTPIGRKESGFYVLKGKPLNAWSASTSKFTANKELSELYQLANLLELEKEGRFYEIEIDGKKMIVNENDEILIENKWISVKNYLKKS